MRPLRAAEAATQSVTSSSAPGPDHAAGRAAIFLLAFGVLLLEIACTRIFSFSLSYHFTYVAISVALLGFGASGTALATSRWLAGRDPKRLMPEAMLIAAAGVTVTLLTILFLRVRPFDIPTHPSQLVLLALFFVLCATPFFAAGLAIAAALRATALPNTVYFVDLVGAGAGCGLSIAAIWTFGSPGTAVAAAAVFVLASVCCAPPSRRLAYAAIGGVIVAASAALVLQVPVRPSPEKLLARMMEKGFVPQFSRWSPIFRVDVYPEPLAQHSGGRGVSPNLTRKMPRVRYIAHDATAEAPIYEWGGDVKELDYVRQSIFAAPYLSVDRPRVLVIGLGGGFDVLTALAHGASEVTGVELDPITVFLGKGPESGFNGGVLLRPDVNAVVAEGRSFLRHSTARYDVIQMTGVDTLSALSTGAYMLAESYLHTIEAMEEQLRHLTPDGTLSLMVYDLPWQENQARFSLRHVANFLGAAERMGIENPADHVAIIAGPGWPIASIELLFKPRPYRPDEVQTLRDFVRSQRFEAWHLPGEPPTTPFGHFLTGDPAARAAFVDTYPLNISATPDDRPFYYRFYYWRNLFSRAHWQIDHGYTFATGQFILLAVLAVAIVTSLALIVGPLLARPAFRLPGAARFSLYFTALGLGFMFIEISLIQQFILLLGHPTYSVAIILLALLLWTGLGSFLSGRSRLSERTLIRGALLALLVLVPLYGWLVPWWFGRWLGAPAWMRYAVTVAILLPLGLTLGIFFPSGLREVRRHHESLVPWAWGGNGAASVVGSILSIVLAISFGFRVVLLTALAVYVVGVWALLSTAPAAGERAH
jgi:SAM-dependent methyltransferase